MAKVPSLLLTKHSYQKNLVIGKLEYFRLLYESHSEDDILPNYPDNFLQYIFRVLNVSHYQPMYETNLLYTKEEGEKLRKVFYPDGRDAFEEFINLPFEKIPGRTDMEKRKVLTGVYLLLLRFKYNHENKNLKNIIHLNDGEFNWYKEHAIDSVMRAFHILPDKWKSFEVDYRRPTPEEKREAKKIKKEVQQRRRENRKT